MYIINYVLYDVPSCGACNNSNVLEIHPHFNLDAEMLVMKLGCRVFLSDGRKKEATREKQ